MIGPSTATPAEIAAIRRRYLWTATSIAFLDLGIRLIYSIVSGVWSSFWISAGAGFALLFAAGGLAAMRLFGPIHRFLAGDLAFDDVQRRLTQLPLLTAQIVAVLSLLLWTFRL